MTEKEQAKEFQRRRNLPYVEVKYMFTKRTSDTQLKLCGRDLGSKTEVTTRGKVTNTLYILPEMES